MPQPSHQVSNSLAVKLTRTEKQALDLLAAWALCDTDQLAGLMGGVTRRRANQVLRSLADHGLIRADGSLHVLTDEGLTYLARRDRAAVGQVLDRWSAEPSLNNPHVYAGTALRTVASQPDHHSALTTLAANLPADCACSREYGVLDLLPTSRSAVGYWHDPNYVVHPDVSFILDLPEGYRYCFMEYERRATTPRRVRARLEKLSPLLPARLRPPRPRRGMAPGSVRVRDTRRRGRLPGRRRLRGPCPLRQLQPGDHHGARHPG